MWTQDTVKKRLQELAYRCSITRSEMKNLHMQLTEDEQLLSAVEAELKHVHDKKSTFGMVFLTNRRLVFFRKSIIGTVTVEEFPIPKISSTSFRKGIIQGSLIVHTSHNHAEYECFDKQATEVMNRKLQELIQNATAKPSTTSAVPMQSTADHLEMLDKLFKLKQAGALTEEEFQSQKQRLLS